MMSAHAGWIRRTSLELQGSGGRGMRGGAGTLQGTPGRMRQGRMGLGPGGGMQALSMRLNARVSQKRRIGRFLQLALL